MRKTKTKREGIDFSEIPELTEEDFKRARRPTPEETEAFRKAIEKKLGVPRPPRAGRPPKRPEEKYRPISFRMPPEVREWLVTQADKAGVEGYQTFLSMFLRGMGGYEVVREGGQVSLKDPKSKHTIRLGRKAPTNTRRAKKLREHKAGRSRPL